MGTRLSSLLRVMNRCVMIMSRLVSVIIWVVRLLIVICSWHGLVICPVLLNSVVVLLILRYMLCRCLKERCRVTLLLLRILLLQVSRLRKVIILFTVRLRLGYEL